MHPRIMRLVIQSQREEIRRLQDENAELTELNHRLGINQETENSNGNNGNGNNEQLRTAELYSD